MCCFLVSFAFALALQHAWKWTTPSLRTVPGVTATPIFVAGRAKSLLGALWGRGRLIKHSAQKGPAAALPRIEDQDSHWPVALSDWAVPRDVPHFAGATGLEAGPIADVK